MHGQITLEIRTSGEKHYQEQVMQLYSPGLPHTQYILM